MKDNNNNNQHMAYTATGIPIFFSSATNTWQQANQLAPKPPPPATIPAPTNTVNTSSPIVTQESARVFVIVEKSGSMRFARNISECCGLARLEDFLELKDGLLQPMESNGTMAAAILIPLFNIERIEEYRNVEGAAIAMSATKNSSNNNNDEGLDAAPERIIDAAPAPIKGWD